MADEFMAFDCNYTISLDVQTVCALQYERREPAWLKYLVDLKIVKRRYDWLAFHSRFFLYCIENDIHDDLILDVERKMDYDRLAILEGYEWMDKMHRAKTPVGHCYYTIFNRHEFKYLFGKVIEP